MLEEEVAANPNTTIFIPTGIAITVETLIRNVERLKAAAGSGADLKLRIRFSSQGHERRGLHPSYFGLQLKRWHDRAGNVDMRFGVEVESMAQQYSAISGLNINWVPWPNEATNCKPGETPVDPSAPHIYIYASRQEQGSSSVYGIVRDLQKTLPEASRYTVHLNAKGSGLGTAQLKEIAMTRGVAITRGELAPAQLHSLFSNAAAMILPYHAQRYRGRGSALMWAALDHSVPIIAPANTGFGEDISRHGIGFSYQSLSDIPTLIRRAIDEGDALRKAIDTYNIRRTRAVELFLCK
jgi:glycosyltransferase involved in cell wall biosynthesis